MSHTPPIPESLWKTVAQDAQAALMAVFDSLRCRIAELDQRVADLEARLNLNPPIPPSPLRRIPSA